MFKRYKNLKKFNSYYKKYKNIIRLLLICMIIASSLGMALTYFMSQRLISLTELNLKSVLIFSGLTIVTILTHHIGWFYWEKLSAKINNLVCLDIKKELYSKILDTKYFNIKNFTSGYYIERLNEDVYEVSSFITTLMGTLVDAITNFSFLIIIFVLSYQSGIIITAGVIIICVIDFIRIKKNLEFTEKLKLLSEKYNTKITETVKGIKDIKCLGIKTEMIYKNTKLSKQISDIEIKKASTFAFYSRIKTFLQYLLEGILILVAVFYLIPQGNITVVVLLVVLNYIGFMFELIEYFTNLKNHLVNSEFKAERLQELFENNNLEKFGKMKKVKSISHLKITGLKYSYEDDKLKYVLKDINIDIRKNTLSLISGKSGSGKSTLFSLLTRLNTAEDNKILINDICINKYSEENFRSIISVVNQEIFLTNDTIYNNIKIANQNAADDEIFDACKKANIYEEIIKLPHKFETIVNENSSNLSGGQKQRIAIARAILKNSDIILFDEPTSALDKNNHESFYKMLVELKKNKIIIVIAHNCEKENIFDNKFYLENGILK